MKKRLMDTQNRICPICFNHQGYYLTTVNNIRILRCNQCNMVFADVNEATVEKTCKLERGKILSHYKFSPLSIIAYYDAVIEKIITILGNTNIKLLEFGCGSGMFLRRARKRGLIAQGVDFLQQRKKAKNLVKSREISDEELIYQIKYETTNLDTFPTTLLQQAMASIYYNTRLSKMGIATSAWGLKSISKGDK